MKSDLNFKTEGPDRLKSKDIDKLFYDGCKAYTVRKKDGHLRWYRAPNHDAGVR